MDTISSDKSPPSTLSTPAIFPAKIDDNAHSLAACFIAYWEGFIAGARWDVNHYRVGFGSDTEGPDQINVVKGTTTTRARALANLALRIPQYEAVAVKQLGDLYSKLGVSTKIAVLDICYNYGDLPSSILTAFLHNSASVANAIRAHEPDNSRVNADRRAAEAGLIIADGGQIQ